MSTYQVKYAVRAVIGIEIETKDFTDAKTKADAIMQKEIFARGIESLDENFIYIGIDNLDDWDTDFQQCSLNPDGERREMRNQDILERLEDLLKQATTEHSHYYVASCCREAIAEIKRLREYEWRYKDLCK